MIFHKMNKRYLLGFLIVMLSFNVNGQPNNSQKQLFYKRMEGTIGKEMKIVSNLKRVGKTIEGNYTYIQDEQDSSKRYGHLVDVYGHIDGHNKVTLKEFAQEKDAFTGILKDDRFTGQWNGPESSHLYFMLHENYPAGSIPLKVYYLHSGRSMEPKNPKAPYAQIELTLISPKMQHVVNPAVDSIKKHIGNAFFGNSFAGNNPDSNLVQFEKEFYNQFKAQNKLWKTVPTDSYNWKRAIDMSVVFNSDGLLCLEYLRHGNSGSGHTVSRISHQIFDLKTGKVLSYKNFFKPASLPQLSLLLTLKLKKEFKVVEGVSLKKAGFYVNAVSPNANLYLGGNGIGFVYNNYEIAPPSMGIIDIFLNYDEIKSLLLPGTIFSDNK